MLGKGLGGIEIDVEVEAAGEDWVRRRGRQMGGTHLRHIVEWGR